MSAIVVRNLRKVYSTFKKGEGFLGSLQALVRREKVIKEAVRGVSFTIEPGELVGFLGPNGAGKTTTMKMLAGILYPTSGEARVLGHVPWRREKGFLMRFALVMGQKAQLNWDLPAADSFLLNRDIYEIPDPVYRRRLDELVHLFEIKDVLHVPVRQLSLGERMKCELAASLLHAPEVLLLDEPTIGLDVISQRKLRHFLKTYSQEHRLTILLTSHYMRDIEELCQRVIVINDGTIAFDGHLESLVKTARQRRRIRLAFREDQSGRLEELRRHLGRYGRVASLDRWEAVLEMDRSDYAAALAAILQTVPVEDVDVEEPELEDVVGELFQGTGEALLTTDGAALAPAGRRGGPAGTVAGQPSGGPDVPIAGEGGSEDGG